MPTITAIVHTYNDGLRIARAVESLRACDEVLVIDHGSTDATCAVARQFGARVIMTTAAQCDTQSFLSEARNDWILCLQPTESVSEGLEASLLEWKLTDHSGTSQIHIPILEETEQGWTSKPAETRLVHRSAATWDGWKPWMGAGQEFEGQMLRMRNP